MSSTSADSKSPVLHAGQVGHEVHKLQEMLNHLGYRIPVDGQFGPQTRDAVLHLQHASGIHSDGNVGPATRVALTHALEHHTQVASDWREHVPHIHQPEGPGIHSEDEKLHAGANANVYAATPHDVPHVVLTQDPWEVQGGAKDPQHFQSTYQPSHHGDAHAGLMAVAEAHGTPGGHDPFAHPGEPAPHSDPYASSHSSVEAHVGAMDVHAQAYLEPTADEPDHHHKS